MSLNQIQLTNELLAHLYNDKLVEGVHTNAVPEAVPQMTQQIKHLGNGAKRIALLVDYAGVPFIPDGDLNFLTNVLQACKLSMADVALININTHSPAETSKYLQELEMKQVILFGLQPAVLDLPIHFPPFQLQAFAGCIYLCSPSLPELQQQKDLKLQLWNSLKKLFGLE